MTRVPVTVREGRLLGIVEEDYCGRYVAFKGIPYATPPVGDLRFKDPVPAEPWSGDRDASRHGNVSLQAEISNMIGDEDCLYLNVYVKNVEPSKKRAVMVWIHGGGFFAGTGDQLFFGPNYIVPKDAVLITLNYRLGALGFLNLDDEVATGNQGLKDVTLALRWVQNNISKFGGDPGNVTIFGVSVGSMIVHLLALSPFAEGLFHKAISQSGVATNPLSWTEKAFAVSKGFELAEKLGKVTTDPKVAYEFLKTIDAKELVKVQQNAVFPREYLRKIIVPFGPSIDSGSSNPFFPEHLNNYLSRGVKVPFILGSTAVEGMICLSNLTTQITKEELEYINADFKRTLSPTILSTIAQIPITAEELRTLYFGNKSVSKETLMNYAEYYGDAMFYRGIMQVADVQANLNSNTTYLYQFSYESEKPTILRLLYGYTLPGVGHMEETCYLFYYHVMKQFGLSPPKPDSKDYKMVEYMTQLWTDFAKTGDPTPNSTNVTPVKWTPLQSGDTYDYLNINIDSRMKTFIKGKERWDWESKKNQLD